LLLSISELGLAGHVGLPDKVTLHPLAHSWPGSTTLAQGKYLRWPSWVMIGSIDHNQPA